MYNVLIVDDEQLTRTFLRTIIPKLNPAWHVIGETSDGHEALERLKETTCDLIITDIKMPIMDGVTMCQQVSALYPDIKLIILSGYGEFDYAKKAIKYNVTNYLLKPIVNEDLKEALDAVATQLARRQHQDQSLKRYIELSSNYKDEIITKMLRSIISNTHIQTQALLDLFYRLDVELIEEECLVIVVVPSEQMLAQNGYLHNKDVTSLLIYQTTLDHVDNTSYKVFLDADDRTIIYAPIDHNTDLIRLKSKLCRNLNNVFNAATDQSLNCYVGSPVSELLQLDKSYQSALNALHSQIIPEVQIANYIFAVKGHISDNIRHARNELIEAVSTQTFSDNEIHLHYSIYNMLNQSIDDDRTYQPSTIELVALLDLYEDIHHTYKERESEDSLVDDAIHYIKAHYAEPISLSLIADHLSISPSYLSNIFHASVGQSYIKYLTDLRLKEACYLLLHDKDMTLDKITEMVGYISVKHFSYVFKKHYQITPGQYRKQH